MFRKDTDRFPAPPGVKLAALSCQISFGTGKSYVELQRCLLELSNSTQATRAVALRACGVGVAPQASDSAHHAVIRLDFLCHSINRAVGQARSAPLSGGCRCRTIFTGSAFSRQTQRVDFGGGADRRRLGQR
jgi:hypothetical protein